MNLQELQNIYTEKCKIKQKLDEYIKEKMWHNNTILSNDEYKQLKQRYDSLVKFFRNKNEFDVKLTDFLRNCVEVMNNKFHTTGWNFATKLLETSQINPLSNTKEFQYSILLTRGSLTISVGKITTTQEIDKFNIPRINLLNNDKNNMFYHPFDLFGYSSHSLLDENLCNIIHQVGWNTIIQTRKQKLEAKSAEMKNECSLLQRRISQLQIEIEKTDSSNPEEFTFNL